MRGLLQLISILQVLKLKITFRRGLAYTRA